MCDRWMWPAEDADNMAVESESWWHVSLVDEVRQVKVGMPVRRQGERWHRRQKEWTRGRRFLCEGK